MKLRGAITETKGYKVSGCSSQGNKIWHAQQFTCHTEALYLHIKRKKGEKKKKKKRKRGVCVCVEENHNPITHGNLQPVCVCLITDKSFKAGTILVSLKKKLFIQWLVNYF